MSAQSEKTEGKSGGKQAGSLGQWAGSLGGGRKPVTSERSNVEESKLQTAQASERPAVQTSERSNAQTSGLQNVQTSERSNVETSELQYAETPERLYSFASDRQDAQASKRSDAQTFDAQVKQSKVERKRQTVYLDLDVNRWIRHRIADTEEEISDVVNEAVRLLMRG